MEVERSEGKWRRRRVNVKEDRRGGEWKRVVVEDSRGGEE